MTKSPSVYYFWAGIAAATGTTLMTNIPAFHESPDRALRLGLCSIPWFLLSWLISEIGAVIEDGRRNVDLQSSPHLKAEELNELESTIMTPLLPVVRRKWCWSAAAFVAGVVALVGLLL